MRFRDNVLPLVPTPTGHVASPPIGSLPRKKRRIVHKLQEERSLFSATGRAEHGFFWHLKWKKPFCARGHLFAKILSESLHGLSPPARLKTENKLR
jgi:hypothetical protein